MFWTIFSSRSTRPAARPCASVEPRPRSSRSSLALSAAVGFALLGITAFAPAAGAAKSSRNDAKPAAAQPFGVFGSLEFRTNATAGLAEWRTFQKASAAGRSVYAACDGNAEKCPKQLRAWRSELRHWRSLSGRAQVDAVNRWINARIRYGEDRDLFGVRDKWLTLATSMKGRGDCEDYALAKYETLKMLGHDEKNLRIVIVKDTRKGIGHAVLTVHLDDALYVLDNQDRRVLRHEAVAHYAPVYSINATGRWINIATRKIQTQYVYALEQGKDPAVAARPQPNRKTAALASLDAPSLAVLRPTILDIDLAPAAAAGASRAPHLGTGAREP